MAGETEGGVREKPGTGGMALCQWMRRPCLVGDLGPLNCDIFTCLTMNDDWPGLLLWTMLTSVPITKNSPVIGPVASS